MIAAIALLLVAGAAVGTVLLTRPANQPASHTQSPTLQPEPSQPAATVTVTASPDATSTPPTNEQSFAQLYQDVATGVVRIETTACNGGGVGSGFLVGPNTVATVAHVVSGAISIAIRSGSTTTTGTVIGYDAAHELALIRTSSPLPGHVFTFDNQEPQVGIDIAAIGYPLGGGESLSKGAVSGLGRTITVEGRRLHELVQTDASINPGNSGGPLLTSDGIVVGLVEAKRTDAENIGYAIPATSAMNQIENWSTDPQQVRWSYGCDFPTGPDGETVDITDRSGHPDGPSIADAFTTYVNGINTGDYATAYGMLSPAEQQKISFHSFSAGNVSSYIVDLSVDTVASNSGVDTVRAQFTSVQDPSYGYQGQACSHWSMTYTLLHAEGTWLIDTAAPAPGSPTRC